MVLVVLETNNVFIKIFKKIVDFVKKDATINNIIKVSLGLCKYSRKYKTIMALNE